MTCPAAASQPPKENLYENNQPLHKNPAIIALLALASAMQVTAATIAVTNANDSGPGSLRQAILNADAAAGADTVVFDTTFFSTPRTIVLTSGVLAINGDLTISGPGPGKLTVSGNKNSRVFAIDAGPTVTLSGMTVTNGNSLTGIFPGFGGGIINRGFLTITNVVVTANTATNGGSSGGSGGGIYSINATVTISGTTISDNASTSTGAGGGIYSESGTMTITHSAVTGNRAGSNRSGTRGGGIYNSATLFASNVTISGNSTGFGGSGAGIANLNEITLTNATVVNNAIPDGPASSQGGGVWTDNTLVTRLRNTIVANNTASQGPDVFGPLTSQGYNLIESTTGATITGTTTGNITGQDPKLGPLQNNGGATQTHALLADSPAIDKGQSSGSSTDQRGFLRPFDDPAIPNADGGDGSDIGAYEFSSGSAAKLVNISTRARVQTGDNVLIGGFIVTGTVAKKVYLRALGPSLGNQGVSGALDDPTLELRDDAGALVASNNDWMETQEMEIRATTIPPDHPLESAIVATLAPGAYTATVRSRTDTPGVGLVELYDLTSNDGSKLANISTRGFVQTGDDVMIGGFIIGPAGSGTTRVIARAIGPDLINRGIPGALTDTTLEIRDSSGALVAENDDWRSTQEQEIIDTTVPPNDDRESAIVARLPAGSYTAIVRGKGNSTGAGLVEVYALP